MQKRIDSLLDVHNWDEALRNVKEYERFHASSKLYAASVRAECAFRRNVGSSSSASGVKEAQEGLQSLVEGGDVDGPVLGLLSEILLWQAVGDVPSAPVAAPAGAMAAFTAALPEVGGVDHLPPSIKPPGGAW